MKGGLYISILIVALLSGVTVYSDKILLNKDVTGHSKEISPGNEANRVSNKEEPSNLLAEKINNESNSIVEQTDKDEKAIQKKDDEINSTDYMRDEVVAKSDIHSVIDQKDEKYKSVNDETSSLIDNDLSTANNIKENNELQATEHTKAQTIETEDEMRNKNDKLSQNENIVINENKDNFIHEIEASPNGDEGNVGSLNSTMFSTVNHYCCMAEEINEKELIVYGTKAWQFSLQDVNFTLSYPSAKVNSPSTPSPSGEYIISGFKVILYIDGNQTRAYITSGGVLHDNITMTFINSGISSLYYQFWLYGTPKHLANTDLNKLSHLCS